MIHVTTAHSPHVRTCNAPSGSPLSQSPCWWRLTPWRLVRSCKTWPRSSHIQSFPWIYLPFSLNELVAIGDNNVSHKNVPCTIGLFSAEKKNWEADPRKALCHKVGHTFTRASFLLSLWRRTKVDRLENIKPLRARRCAREIHITSFLDSVCFPSYNWTAISQQLLSLVTSQ